MRLAILVPYRDRDRHLRVFAPHIKHLLPDADLYVIEQEDGKPFNRGKLLNVGYLLAKDTHDYYALHDVDMLPHRNVDYSYPEAPTHLATHCSQFNYRMPYPTYFGGVCLVTNEHMDKSGGFSNEMWGWGGEDDEFRRELEKYFTLQSRPSRFESLQHARIINRALHQKNVQRLRQPRERNDGIQFCDFLVTTTQINNLYTKFTVKI